MGGRDFCCLPPTALAGGGGREDDDGCGRAIELGNQWSMPSCYEEEGGGKKKAFSRRPLLFSLSPSSSFLRGSPRPPSSRGKPTYYCSGCLPLIPPSLPLGLARPPRSCLSLDSTFSQTLATRQIGSSPIFPPKKRVFV